MYNLIVWDLAEQKQITTLSGHTDTVSFILVTGNNQLTSCSYDFTLKIWDLDKPPDTACIATLSGHTRHVSCATLMPNEMLVSGSHDRTLKIWDLDPSGRRCITTLPADRMIETVESVPNGLLVFGTIDGSLEVWDLYQPPGAMHVTTLKGHCASIRCLVVLPNKQLVSGSDDGTLKIWDLTKPSQETCIATLSKAGRIMCSTTFPDGRLVAGYENYGLRIWDPIKPIESRLITTLPGNKTHWIRSVVQFDRQLICSGIKNSKIWDLDSFIDTTEGLIPPLHSKA